MRNTSFTKHFHSHCFTLTTNLRVGWLFSFCIPPPPQFRSFLPPSPPGLAPWTLVYEDHTACSLTLCSRGIHPIGRTSGNWKGRERSRRRCAGRWLTTCSLGNSLVPSGVCHFPWCKHFYHGFQATTITERGVGKRRTHRLQPPLKVKVLLSRAPSLSGRTWGRAVFLHLHPPLFHSYSLAVKSSPPCPFGLRAGQASCSLWPLVSLDPAHCPKRRPFIQLPLSWSAPPGSCWTTDQG